MATSARIDELRKKFDENPRRYFAPLANEYRKAGDLEQAVFICEEYLPQQPGHMSGHIVYGQALFELGRFDEARTVFETALSLDPENLIALRHLGDIARQAGDAHSARVWYQRVLEADPRNEEIAQLMMSLLSTPVSTGIVDHGAPTPLNNPVVTAPGEPRASTPATAGQAESVDQDTAITAEMETPRVTRPSLTPVAPPVVSPQSFVSRHAPKEEELLDLDSFDLGGVPLSSLRNARAAEPESEPESEPAGRSPEMDELESVAHEMSDESDALVEKSYDAFEADAPVSSSVSDISLEDVEIEKAQEITADHFEQDPYAIAARPFTDGEATTFTEDPPGTIELAADIGLGLPDDGGSSSTFATPDASLDGLETFEAGILAGPPSGASGSHELMTESFFDTPDESFVEDTTAVVGDESSQSRAASDETGFETAAPVAMETTPDEPPMLRTPQFERAVEFASPPPPALATPRFHEAQPASVQGDPLMTPAFGAVEPIAEAAVEPDAETAFAHDAATPSAVFSAAETIEDGIAPPLDESIDVADEIEAIASPDSGEAAAHVPSTASSEGTGAFVTETMATLYLEQGHYDAALDIYRQLVEQRPDDIALRDRLHAAEERAWGHHQELGAALFEADAATEYGDVTPAAHSYGGPTIRDFLTGLLFRRNTQAVEEAPSPPDEETAPVTNTGEEEIESVSTEASTVRSSATPSSGDSLSASLGALFSGADAAAPASEEPAGSALGGRVATPTAGAPAHRAPNELSLDHVFKGNTARAGSNQAFSFDQFFSEEAAEQQPPTPEPASEPPSDSNDDIAQFNAWLSGLKKT